MNAPLTHYTVDVVFRVLTKIPFVYGIFETDATPTKDFTTKRDIKQQYKSGRQQQNAIGTTFISQGFV